jgi:hypothetical protein
LVHAGGLDEQELGHVVTDRRDALCAQLNAARHQAQAADAHLTEAERSALSHLISRLAAEVAWHTELLDRLPKIVADFGDRAVVDPGGP